MAHITDEETPLLPPERVQKTPFPWFQFSVIVCLRVLEPLNSHLIDPFLPQLIRETGINNGKEARVGYYTGILKSLFYLSQAFSAPILSTISDQVGRRPVIFLGVFGLTVSMLCFGLSMDFWTLAFAWSMNGAANGMVALVASLMIEITDATNIAQACAYFPIGWQIGTTLAPLIGGTLARPVERFPWLFGSSILLRRFPYLLPCSVAVVISVAVALLAFYFLEETVKNRRSFFHLFAKDQRDKARIHTTDTLEPEHAEEQALPLSALLTPQVLLIAANCVSFVALGIASAVIYPLFLSTPVELGGLGLPPHIIGYFISAGEITGGLLQVLFFKSMHDRWGSRAVFIGGVASVGPACLCLPFMNYLAKTQGLGVMVWSVVILRILFSSGLAFTLGAAITFISEAAPNKASIGATNGICQVAVSITKAVFPALASSLYSLSLEKAYLGGLLVYLVLFLLTGVSILIALPLPRNV